MYIYLIMFGLSCFFIYIGEKNNNKKIGKFFYFFALILPCILAGMRANTIGTDVKIYGLPIYKCAEFSNGFTNFLGMFVRSAKYVKDYEIGFILIEYLGCKIFNSFQIVLFLIQLLIIIPIYYGIKCNEDLKGKKCWAFLVFYFMFYNTGLNLMRQYIGLAFLFLGTNLLLYSTKKNNIKFFICLIIACLFHTSSILGIFIFIICKLLNSKKDKKLIISNTIKLSTKKIKLFLVILFGFSLLFGVDYLVRILNSFGFSYYSQYIDGELTSAKSLIIRNLPMIILVVLLYKNVTKKFKNTYFYVVCFVLNLIILQFSSINLHAARIALFFSIFNIEFYGMLVNCVESKDTKLLIKISVVLYLIFYWYYSFVFLGGSETVPYKFYG